MIKLCDIYTPWIDLHPITDKKKTGELLSIHADVQLYLHLRLNVAACLCP